MKISDFVGQISYANGLARTNRYTVEIPLPKSINSRIQNTDIQMMQIFCDSISLPGLNVNTVQNRSFGEVREIPYEFNYEPIQLTFYTDSNLKIKSMLDNWIKSIQTGTRRTFNYYDDYTAAQMKITVQNIKDEDVYRVVAYEVFPKSINAVSLAYEQKDVMKVQVSMMYKYWESFNLSYQDPQQVKPQPVVTPTKIETNTVTNTTTPEPLPMGNPMGDLSGYGNGW